MIIAISIILIDVKNDKDIIFEFIEGWYNRRRIHSAINYRTPEEIEKQAVWKKNERLLKNKKISKKCPKTWHRSNNYAIIKFHTSEENRDVYIGSKDMNINDLEI